MELIIVAADSAKLENKESVKELNDLELAAIGGGCAESTPY